MANNGERDEIASARPVRAELLNPSAQGRPPRRGRITAYFLGGWTFGIGGVRVGSGSFRSTRGSGRDGGFEGACGLEVAMFIAPVRRSSGNTTRPCLRLVRRVSCLLEWYFPGSAS